MDSRNFGPIVEPRFTDSTKMQVIRRGAAQSNKILADFKRGSKPVPKAKGGPVGCGCGGSVKK